MLGLNNDTQKNYFNQAFEGWVEVKFIVKHNVEAVFFYNLESNCNFLPTF